MILVDSCQSYGHTLRELDLWFDQLTVGGLMVLHDVSEQAMAYDSTAKGGVRRAVNESAARRHVPRFLLNEHVRGGTALRDIVYLDGRGLGIIQKDADTPVGAPTEATKARPVTLEEEVTELRQQLTGLLNSRLWGVTRPLRVLMGALRRMR